MVTDLASEADSTDRLAVGVDAVDIAEFSRDIELAGEAFVEMCFVPEEIEHCAGDPEKLASRFALKEAALKVLGTGIRGIGLKDVSVSTAPSGQPSLQFSQAAGDKAAECGLTNFCCSATHESGLALAVVIANRS